LKRSLSTAVWHNGPVGLKGKAFHALENPTPSGALFWSFLGGVRVKRGEVGE